MSKWIWSAIIFVVGFVGLFYGILALKNLGIDVQNMMVEVPTEKRIQDWLPEFSFPDIPVKGLYVNYDSGGLIFYYDLSGDNQNKSGGELWQRVNSIVVDKKWEILDRSKNSLSLRRISKDATLSPAYPYSVEETTIVLKEDKLFVAHIQHDTAAKYLKLFEPGKLYQRGGGKYFWPLFQKYVNEDGAVTGNP